MKLRTLIASFTALAGIGIAHAAETYNYWVGPVEGGNWNDAANWSRGGQATGPISYYSYWNRVTNQVPVSINLDANQSLKGLYLDPNVDLTIVGDGAKYLEYYGGGFAGKEGSKLHLKDVVLRERGGSSYPTASVSVPELEIVDGGVVTLSLHGSYPQKTTTFSSALTGGGTISVASSSSDGTIWKFTGDNSGFEGLLTAPSAASKARVVFASSAAGSAKAKFNFDATAEGTVTVDCPSDSTLQFGELTGAGTLSNANPESAVTLEVGALGTDFSCGLNFGGLNVRKVGSGLMLFAGSNVGAVTLASGGLCLMDGAAVEELAVEGGVIDVAHSAYDKAGTVTIAALADGTTAEAVAAALATGVELTDNGDGSYVLTRAAESRPSTFTWRGGFDDGLWSNRANWVMPTGAMSVEAPGAEDAVVFPAGHSVARIADTTSVGSVQVDGTLTLTGPSATTLLTCNTYTGEGTLSTGDIRLGASTEALTIACRTFDLIEGMTTDLYLSQLYSGNISANLTGKGTLTADYRGKADVGVRFSGNNMDFEGTFEARNEYSGRGGTRMAGPEQTSAKAVWNFRAGMRNNSDQPIFQDSENTYSFGAFIGSVQGGYTNPYIEIGGRDDVDSDFTFKGRANSSGVSTKCHVTKVGGAHLALKATTFNGTASKHIGDVTIKGGTIWTEYVPTDFLQFEGGTLIHNASVVMEDEVETIVCQDPSAVIKNSTCPISFDTCGTNATWATALASSNVGGLVKKGAGTLTLAEVPGYAGVTTVEAGELVVPAETRIHWDILSAGTLTGVLPTSYDYQVGTTNVYDSAAATPSAGNHTLNLDNLVAIDLTAVKTVEKSSKFVIAEAKAFNVDGKAITRSGREKIELIWGEDTVFPQGKTAADFTLQVVNGQLVVANKAVGLAIIIK